MIYPALLVAILYSVLELNCIRFFLIITPWDKLDADTLCDLNTALLPNNSRFSLEQSS